MLQRLWDNLIARPGGPLSFRFVIQPCSALVIGIIAGLRDAKQGRPAYLWALFTASKPQRRALLRDGWKGVWKIFVLAFVLDVVFQLIELRWIYPLEALIVAVVLACIPYALVRGPTNRIATRLHARNERRRALHAAHAS